MPQLSDHLRLAILINGVFQVKPNTIRLSLDSGAQMVETLEGLAGKTPGSGKATISLTCAVPIGGPERDFLTDCVEGTFLQMQVPFGTKSYIGTGWVQTAEISQSTNGATELSMEWQGQFQKPQ